jgi:hypothetical protein
VVVHADAFTRIRASLGSRPGLAAVFGSYDDAPPGTGVVSAFRNLLHHHVHQGAPGLASTFWAGLGAVRRDDFEAVGGFDEVHYRVPSIEDVELGMRLVEAGSWIELDPGLQGTHLKRWTLVEMVRTDFSRRGIPWVMLLLRRGHGSSALNLGWRHRLSALACLAAVGAAAARRPGLAGTATLAFVSLNLPFYRLLLRRQGPLEATAGVGLHALHHLVGIAALPVGVVRYLLENRGVEPLGVATGAVSRHTEESLE